MAVGSNRLDSRMHFRNRPHKRAVSTTEVQQGTAIGNRGRPARLYECSLLAANAFKGSDAVSRRG